MLHHTGQRVFFYFSFLGPEPRQASVAHSGTEGRDRREPSANEVRDMGDNLRV